MMHSVLGTRSRPQFMFTTSYYFNYSRQILDCSLIISKTKLCEALGVWDGSRSGRGDQGESPG